MTFEVQSAGSSSWRLEIKGGQLCEQALFVRDAARLEITDAAGDVPALTGSVPDLSVVLTPGARAEANGQWPRWWAQLVAQEFKDRRQDDGDASARHRLAQLRAIYDPPEFGALTDRPALRVAAGATFEAFRRWQSARSSHSRDGLSGSPLDWALMKQTAEDVAFDRRVDIGGVQASVAILLVHGIWWRRVSPGCVLCSTDAASDPTAAQVLLRDAFDSHVLASA